MVEANWQQVRKVFNSALHRKPEERQRFVKQVCDGDKNLLSEVESLLSSYDSAGNFMETPAVAKVAHLIEAETGTLEMGKRFGHYEIIEQIGAGGMGEVYLAEDMRLHRRVAIKFISPLSAIDFQAEKRLMREAQASAVLDHPNICAIHEVGEADGNLFIVMQYVKGETLAEKLRRGRLTVNQAVGIAIQIADALTEAHSQGIIHRDIKPANVIIDERGQVKVLDFSLAKNVFLSEQEPESQKVLSQPGMIFGTVAYMSPEQARGLPLDARSDLWSLGVVLYEMLTGKQPFDGETTSDILAAILKTEAAPIHQTSREISPELERINQKLLGKSRTRRYQTARDLLLDLKNLRHNPAEDFESDVFETIADAELDSTKKQRIPTGEQLVDWSTAETEQVKTQKSVIFRRRFFWVIPLVFLLIGVAGWAWWQSVKQKDTSSSSDLASMRQRMLVSWNSEAGEGESEAKFSPNGTMIAYSLMKNGLRNVWTKQVPDGKPNPVTDGKGNYRNPIWSPNGQRIACLSDRDNQTAIWALPFSGGELKFVKTLDSPRVSLKKWSDDGATIYYQSEGNLFALAITSGKITRLTNFDSSNTAQFLSISPENERVAYSADVSGRLHIFTMPIGGGQPVQITKDQTSNDEFPVWMPDGKRIIYNCKRDGIFQTCIAYLDENRTGQINLGSSDAIISDISSDGGKILLSQSREECDLWQTNLEEKKADQFTSDFGLEVWSDVSSDGKSVVFQAATEDKHLLEGSILIHSTEDDWQIKIASNGFNPTFSPDGGRVAFLRFSGNQLNLWTVSRSGADEKLVTSDDIWFDGFAMMPYNRAQIRDYSWSPDGSSFAYCSKKSGTSNVCKVASDGSGEPQQISNNTDPNLKLTCPLWSPDGDRVAFVASSIKVSADKKNVWSIQSTNGEKTDVIFSSESVLKLVGWTQTGDNLIFAMSENGKYLTKPAGISLFQISMDGKWQSKIAKIESAYFDNLRLSPDGQKIAVATHKDGKDNIEIVSGASGQITKITENTDPNIYFSDITWSPDGKTIFYSKQHRVGLIFMIDNFK